ncbi:MAG: DUF3179 domain-containing protein [Candidatus Lambdaproteobacteria bacterium]|nr:DUF3179 domain-containing protein [Candidatus Lambdaproteobacteria bacterium]
MLTPARLLPLLLALPLSLPAGLAAPVRAQDVARPVAEWRQEWPRTDFSRHTVPLAEIISGGPPRDGIPPIDRPRFVSAAEAAHWLAGAEPVLVFTQGSDARAYPLQILIWHEIVNDTVGGEPVVVTYCPLCNSALVFERRAAGHLLDFGTTGKLRGSDLVMWDRQTESWWQQITGEAIVGRLAGSRLAPRPAPLVAFATFRATYPRGQVLSRETGFQRDYGSNPYVGYDNQGNTQPFLFLASVDRRLSPMERVVSVELGGMAKAYPYRELARVGAVNDRVGGQEIVVLYESGARSALDGPAIAQSRDVGAAAVFDRRLDGKALTFALKAGALLDRETGTRWNLLGQGVEGPLKGQHLTPVTHGNPFAFAWLAFRPASAIYHAP